MRKEKEKAHLNAATSRQAAGADFTGRGFQKDCNTAAVSCRGKTADLLHRGKDNAITLRDLVSLTGWNERDIRRRIHFERKAGYPIISDNLNGYFLAEDAAELKRFARSMSHRAAEIAAVACAAEDAAARAEGQERLGGW